MHRRHVTLFEKPCFHCETSHFGLAPITVHFGRLLARAEIPFFGGSGMRKGLQTLDFSFEAESLTHFGGLFLIQRFCNKSVCAADWSVFSRPLPIGSIIIRLIWSWCFSTF